LQRLMHYSSYDDQLASKTSEQTVAYIVVFIAQQQFPNQS